MSVSRKCSRTACPRAAIATLTYVYADSTVVLGPLATYAEPHTYDLCEEHAGRLTAPRGWEVVRLGGELGRPENHDDLAALANVVRDANRDSSTGSPGSAGKGRVSPQAESAANVRETSRRGHLRVLRDEVDADH